MAPGLFAEGERAVWLAPMTPQACRSRPEESHYNPLGLERTWAGFLDEVA